MYKIVLLKLSVFWMALCAEYFTVWAETTLPEDRLWLPIKYQGRYLDLVQAANLVMKDGSCADILEGTVDLDASSKGKVVFRILCRPDVGRSFVRLVDADELRVWEEPHQGVMVLSKEQVEARRLAADKRKALEIQQKKKEHWMLCKDQIDYKIRFMENLVWLDEVDSPEPREFSDNRSLFVLEFDARGMRRELLHYAVDCLVEEGVAKATLRIR